MELGRPEILVCADLRRLPRKKHSALRRSEPSPDSASARASALLAGVHPDEEFAFLEDSWALSEELRQLMQTLIPPKWRLAKLQLDAGTSAVACARAVKHRLWNLVTDEEIQDFPERFFEVTTCLHAVYSMHRQAWDRCVITARRVGKRLKCETHYYYGGPPSPR